MEVLTVFGFYCNNNASILFSNSMCVGGEITCIVYYFFLSIYTFGSFVFEIALFIQLIHYVYTSHVYLTARQFIHDFFICMILNLQPLWRQLFNFASNLQLSDLSVQVHVYIHVYLMQRISLLCDFIFAFSNSLKWCIYL